MLDNKTIYTIVKNICGKEAAKLFWVLKNRKNFSEFKLAEKIDKNINETRNLLYTLNQVNLVSAIRKKDKKKGWYVYYWTFNPKAAKPLMLSQLKKSRDDLKKRLEREKNSAFFICSSKCVRADFDQAAGFGFRCPECGELMNPEDNAEKTRKIEVELRLVEKRLRC